jgi:Phosphorylase superfamily
MELVQILAPTLLEYWAVRRTLPNAGVQWAGVRLARWKVARADSIVVVCGLAGALVPGLRPGMVLVPAWVGLPDGRTMRCDPALVQALAAAARTLGFQPEGGPLLTAPSMVVGPARQEWAARGFVAVDMETGLLAGRNLRVATIRVVLDSLDQGISRDWLEPAGAMRRPTLWRELVWLCRVAPPYALRAARVLKVALELVVGCASP